MWFSGGDGGSGGGGGDVVEVEVMGVVVVEVVESDLVYSSWICPGSGGKNLTDSLNRVLAGPEERDTQGLILYSVCVFVSPDVVGV